MTDLASAEVLVYGHVQGVFFRVFASRQARELDLTGTWQIDEPAIEKPDEMTEYITSWRQR